MCVLSITRDLSYFPASQGLFYFMYTGALPADVSVRHVNAVLAEPRMFHPAWNWSDRQLPATKPVLANESGKAVSVPKR